MTSEELKEVQHVDLEIAKYFVDFCRKHDLLCYFCGGGCIGTIRHKGFIPWDDDLDFFMPRADYEKLKKLWKNSDDNRYALVFPSKDYNDHNIFITIRDKKTTMIKTYQADLEMVHGITVDVFPLDGCPANKLSRKVQLFWGLVYQLYCAQIVPQNHGKFVEIVGKVALNAIADPNKRYKVWKYAEKQMSKYSFDSAEKITELCAGPRYMRNMYPQKCFAKAVFKQFEDTQMPIPVGYDKYLKMAFGEYMKLPPKEKRVTEHDAVLIDTKTPYTEYRYKYYLVGHRRKKNA